MSYPIASDYAKTPQALLTFACHATAAWHRAFGVEKHQASRFLIAQRKSLQDSEHDETERANMRGDAHEVLDGMMDELFVAAGTMDALHPDYLGHVQGRCASPMELIEDFEVFPIEDLFQAFEVVVKANFGKLWKESELQSAATNCWKVSPAPGQEGMYVVRDGAGKIMKPPSWVAPLHENAPLIAQYIQWYSKDSLI